ncbi:phage protein [Staphylococcus aureus]|nr:phage protein [Staphylococcus aureus]CAA6150821.1 phage protein [Staphylococcus aureus]
MKSAYQIQKELENKVFKPEYTYEPLISNIEGETIDHIFYAALSVNTELGLPEIILVTKSKKIVTYCLGVDEYMKEECDLLDIDAMQRAYLSEEDFIHKFIRDEIRFEGSFTKEKLPFIDQEALKEYEDFKHNKYKEVEEKYQKELEYKRYLELKEKYENN